MRVALSLGMVALLGVLAAPAQATLRVESSSSGLNVIDKNGFGSTTTISAATQGGDPVYVVLTSSTSLDFIKYDFGPNCSEGSTNTRAVCKRLSGKLNLNMAGGNDTVFVGGSGATRVSANLGEGNDEYHGISGPDDVFPGSGADDVDTGAGNDDITVTTGSDIVNAGSGSDRIDLPASSPVNGAAFVRVKGKSGNDTIDLPYLRDGQKVFAEGGPGDDTITTGHGDDFVNGEGGADTISTGRGNDQIDSKESVDNKAAVRDTVRCGFDDDDVVADLKDAVDAITNSGGGTCEEVDRSAVGETPLVKVTGKTLRVSRGGRVKVRLRCPRGVRRLGCKGRLQLRIGRAASSSRSRRVRYRITAGRRKTVMLKLTRRDVRTLRRQKRRKVKSRGILVSVENGRLGRKTTIRNPRLRLR